MKSKSSTLAGVQLACAPQPHLPQSNVIKRQLANLACLLFVSHALSANATDWYLDNTAKGANDGTSWANAWTNLSEVKWNDGDTLYISGGPTGSSQVYYVTNFILLPYDATIRLDAGDVKHNGTAIFDGSRAGDTNAKPAVFKGRDGVTIDGEANGASHMLFRNYVDYLHGTQARPIFTSSAYTNMTFRYLTFSNCNNGMRLNSCSGLLVEHCTFDVRGDAGLSASGINNRYDDNIVRYCTFIQNVNVANPSGKSGYDGPDGIQSGTGFTIVSNTFYVQYTTNYTSPQHPDAVQGAGNYEKVLCNDFIGVGDSSLQNDPHKTGVIHDKLFANNVFQCPSNYWIGAYPEVVRMYTSSGELTGYSNIFWINNTVIDRTEGNTHFTHWAADDGTSPGRNNYICNNLYVNVGAANSDLLQIQDAYDQWTVDGNVYWLQDLNNAYIFESSFGRILAKDWVKNEPHGAFAKPTFVSYTPFGTNNNFHLASADTVASSGRYDLSALTNQFPELMYDKDGKPRGVNGEWSAGAYAPAASPKTSVVAPSGLHVLASE